MAAPPLWRIGRLAKELGRKPNTIHKWEADGVIAEPLYRSGSTFSNRQYTKGELDLIVKASKWWWLEYRTYFSKVMRPKLFRLGQIYWKFRRHLIRDAKYGLVFIPPVGAKLPPMVDFDTDEIINDLYLVDGEPCSIMDKIKEVSRLIRDNPQWRVSGEMVERRIEVMSVLYTTMDKDVLIQKLWEYQDYAKSS